jgi:hypothetical protein
MKKSINEVFAFWDNWIEKNLPQVGLIKYNQGFHWQFINKEGKEVNFYPSTGVIYVEGNFSTKGQRLSTLDQQNILKQQLLGEE